MEWDPNEAVGVPWKQQQKKDCERGKMENIGSWELPMVLLRDGLEVMSFLESVKDDLSSRFILLFK